MEIIYLDHYTAESEYYKQLELLPIPELQVFDEDDAGVDMRAAIEDTITLQPGESVVIPSGVKMFIGSHPAHRLIKSDDGWDTGVYGCILPRSGLGFKHFVRLANTAGVIDAGFQDEIMIKVRNEGDDVLTIERGDRICQIIFHIYIKGIQFNVVDEFSNETNRGTSGFGDSGVK